MKTYIRRIGVGRHYLTVLWKFPDSIHLQSNIRASRCKTMLYLTKGQDKEKGGKYIKAIRMSFPFRIKAKIGHLYLKFDTSS